MLSPLALHMYHFQRVEVLLLAILNMLLLLLRPPPPPHHHLPALLYQVLMARLPYLQRVLPWLPRNRMDLGCSNGLLP